MRFFLHFAVAVAVMLDTACLAQQFPPAPESRPDIPADRCRIELTLPPHAKVTIDERDYGEQRTITLPIPNPASARHGWGGPCFYLNVQFSNGGERSTYLDAKGGTVTRVALSSPPIETLLLEGPREDITSIAFSPDGRWIVMGTGAQQAIVWETATGWIRWNGEVPFSNAADDSTSVAFSPDGRHVLAGTGTGGVVLLDVATGKRLRDYGDDSSDENRVWANAVAFSPDGLTVAVALSWWQNQPVVAIFETNTGKRLKMLHGPKPPANDEDHSFHSIALTHNGRWVAASPRDPVVVLFDIATGKMLQQFASKSGPVKSIAISPDDEKLLVGTSGTTAILWELKTGKQIRTFHCATDEYGHEVSSVAFSPGGRQALAGSGNHVFLFDVTTGEKLRVFGSSDDDNSLAVFGPDGRNILTSGSRNWWSYREAVLWEGATGKRIRAFRGPKDAIGSLAFSEDGRHLSVTYKGGWTTNWDMGTGKPVGEERTKMPGKVVGKEESAPRENKTSDAENDSPFEQDTEDQNCPTEYKSPDGRWTVTWVGCHTVVTIDPQTSKETTGIEGNAVLLTDSRASKKTKILDFQSYEHLRVAFSPKTPRIAVADDESVHIFNPETGKELATFFSAYEGKDWLATTPANYFDGSAGGRSLLRWRVGEAEYSYPHFEKDLCCPESIGKSLREE